MNVFFYEGLSCPVCKKPFEAGEDIVACPQCGLPHHRACWKSEGSCHESTKHGTPEQWSREKAQAAAVKGHVPPEGQPRNQQICPHCYTRNAEYAEYCTHCGRHLRATDWHSAPPPPAPQPPVGEYTPFQSPYTTGESYSASERIGEASASDLAAIVSQNTQYYIPRFRTTEQGGSAGWNWSAFLLGPFWLLYRKQYAVGLFMFVIQVILNLATAILYAPINSAATAQAMAAAMAQMADDRFFLPTMALSIILFVARLMLGLRGNDLYKLHCERRIRIAREKTPDLSSAELTSSGGTSIGVAAAFYLLSSLLSNVFAVLMTM